MPNDFKINNYEFINDYIAKIKKLENLHLGGGLKMVEKHLFRLNQGKKSGCFQ